MSAGICVQASSSFRTDKAKESFEEFMKEPTCRTAREFYISISANKRINDDKTAILDYIFGSRPDIGSFGLYSIIAIEMLHGNIYSTKSAIKLLEFVNCGWQKPHYQIAQVRMRIGESLGELIRVNPALFLRACYEEGGDPYIRINGFPVTYLPLIMSKRASRAYYELEMRREALQSVEDPKVRSVRNECLEIISRQMALIDPNISLYKNGEAGSNEDNVEKAQRVFVEIQRKPSPENMKKVLALFPENTKQRPSFIFDVIFPRPESHQDSTQDSPELIFHEARCGNEYAIEILLRSLIHVFGLDSMAICSCISNLILMKPALFIEKISKYKLLLEATDSISYPDRTVPLRYFNWTCDYISPFDYPEDCENVILRRRIEALAALNIPEHKDLINTCIDVIEKKLAGNIREPHT